MKQHGTTCLKTSQYRLPIFPIHYYRSNSRPVKWGPKNLYQGRLPPSFKPEPLPLFPQPQPQTKTSKYHQANLKLTSTTNHSYTTYYYLVKPRVFFIYIYKPCVSISKLFLVGFSRCPTSQLHIITLAPGCQVILRSYVQLRTILSVAGASL